MFETHVCVLHVYVYMYVYMYMYMMHMYILKVDLAESRYVERISR